MLYKELKEQLSLKPLARFTIIESPSSYANRDIAYFLANKDFVYVCGNKVDDVREIIVKCYEQTSKTIYLFLDADNMTAAAKNALLKVTEEPPQNSYFIMCIRSKENTLETLLSRANVISLPVLTSKEIGQYVFEKNVKISPTDLQLAKSICTTVEQANSLLTLNSIKEFLDFVEKVVDNIPYVTVTNALKILEHIKFNDEHKDKYDLALFLIVYMRCCINFYMQGKIDMKVLKNIAVSTLKVTAKLNVTTVNKQNAMEIWIMEQWEILGGEKIE